MTALDAKAAASGSSATASSGAATTTSANELIFGANTVATGHRGREWVHLTDHHSAGR